MRDGWRGARTSFRSLAVVAVLLVVCAACTGEPQRDLPDVDVHVETPGGAPDVTASPSVAPGRITAGGRLAVLDGAGNLVTMNPDGSGEVLLAEAEPGVTEVRQPAWAPDGARLAWVRIDADDTGATSSVVATASPDGARPTESATEVIAFYLSWDPTSSRIAYLGSLGPEALEMGVVEVADGGTATPLGEGQPFYLSWAPSGDELLVHVGEDRLERLGLDGSLTTVDDRPGTFFAPAWTSDGRTFVFVTEAADGQRLVSHDVERDAGRELVPFDGRITFVANPDGRRVAFQVTDGEGVHALSVVDLRSGEIVEVAEALVFAYFWSPAGDRLLYLVPDDLATPSWFRWEWWDGSSTFATPRFVPSLVFARDYLPFFEQYAQSMSPWAPDGSAFAYAGMGDSGEQGIWVQPARPERAPVLVGDGVFVNWSPA